MNRLLRTGDKEEIVGNAMKIGQRFQHSKSVYSANNIGLESISLWTLSMIRQITGSTTRCTRSSQIGEWRSKRGSMKNDLTCGYTISWTSYRKTYKTRRISKIYCKNKLIFRLKGSLGPSRSTEKRHREQSGWLGRLLTDREGNSILTRSIRENSTC